MSIYTLIDGTSCGYSFKAASFATHVSSFSLSVDSGYTDKDNESKQLLRVFQTTSKMVRTPPKTALCASRK